MLRNKTINKSTLPIFIVYLLLWVTRQATQGLTISRRDQTDPSQQARRNGPNFIHVLRLKALAVTQVKEAVIRQTMSRHVVECQIAHDNPELVLARSQEA